MFYLLAFSIGILSISLLSALPDSNITFIVLIILLFGSLYKRYFLLVSMVFGISIGLVHAYLINAGQWPSHLEGQKVFVEGIIIGLPQQNKNRYRFTFRIESMQIPSVDVVAQNSDTSFIIPHAAQYKINVSWYDYPRNRLSKGVGGQDVELRPGQRWRFTLKMKRPRGFVNPSGFDYHAHLLRQQIMATAYVVNTVQPQLIDERCWRAIADCLRWKIKHYIIEQSSFLEAQAPFLALAIGDTSNTTSAQWELLRKTGTLHLFAISGLHIGIAAVIGFFIGRGLLKVSVLFFPFAVYLQRFPALCSIILAAIYSVLAGMGLPTKRALTMVVLFHLGSFFYYRCKPVLLLSAALAIVSILDPLALYSQGFYLSFLAVALLLYGFTGRRSVQLRGPFRYVHSLIRSQWILVIGLFLPSLYLLQGVSLSAPIANILAIFLVSAGVVPLIFLFLFFLPWATTSLGFELCRYVYGVIEMLLLLLWDILSWFQGIAFWNPTVETPSLVTAILVVIGVTWILAPKGIPFRALGCLCFLPLFFSGRESPQLAITFMDVGQGTSVVVQTQQHTLVYDVGRVFSPRFSSGEHIVAPYLRSLGTSHIDKLMVSHKDGDHAGGVPGLLNAIPTTEIVSGQTLDDSISQHYDINQCEAGQQWQWDGVDFTVLWPTVDVIQNNSTKGMGNNNNRSCVLLIRYKGQSILLAGDIEKTVEKQLIRTQQLPLAIGILLVPHHGSKTSSSVAWLERLKPKWAVVTAGFRNQYKHPHPDIVKRYESVNSQVINTADSGAVRFTFVSRDESIWGNDNESQWKLEQWRKDYKRYWYD